MGNDGGIMTPTEFQPVSALVGGALIGLAAVALMLGNGRIAGASGIFAGLFTRHFNDEFIWRLLFTLGMLLGAAINSLLFFDTTKIVFGGGRATIVAAGVIVGIGTILGSGCTSGHGICGLARFSKRSLVATCTFMAVAIITVFVTRHVLGV
jgi:uncharacterized protein